MGSRPVVDPAWNFRLYWESRVCVCEFLMGRCRYHVESVRACVWVMSGHGAMAGRAICRPPVQLSVWKAQTSILTCMNTKWNWVFGGLFCSAWLFTNKEFIFESLWAFTYFRKHRIFALLLVFYQLLTVIWGSLVAKYSIKFTSLLLPVSVWCLVCTGEVWYFSTENNT